MPEKQKTTLGYFGVGKRLLSVKEAADYLGLKVQTMYNWRHDRKGPDYVMIGGSPKYEMESLERFIELNRVKLNT